MVVYPSAFRCSRYRRSVYLSSLQAAVAAAAAGMGRQGVTTLGKVSQLPATTASDSCQILVGGCSGSIRLLNISGLGTWNSRVTHHRLHENTRHQKHVASNSLLCQVKAPRSFDLSHPRRHLGNSQPRVLSIHSTSRDLIR